MAAMLPALVLVLLTVFGANPVQAAVCPGASPTTDVTFDTYPARTKARTGLSRGDLQRLQNRHGGAAKGAGWYPLGLTLAEFQFDMAVTVTIQPLPRGRYCAVPSAVKVTMGYPQFTIYVDRRYPRGGCEYNAILDHENEHVDLFQEHAERHIPWFRERLLREVRRLQPVFVSSPGRAADLVQRRLASRLAPDLGKFNRLAETANARIDTARNYVRIQAQCRRW